MAEEEVQQDFSKLDTEERLKHKNWKARISAYEELTKLFLNAESPEDAEFKKYASKVKDFVQDSHAAAQEKGLEAAVAFVDNASPPLAGKICGDVVAGILAKCLTASKIKTREKGIEIVMLYFELEKHEIALEELVKGLTNKSPKVVSACVAVIRDALRLFGSKYVSIKVVLKAIHPLLADRDKSVREEAKALFVEIYRWIGEAIKPQLVALQPVQITELETEFAKLKGTKAVPEKLVRSEQAPAALENTVAAAEGRTAICLSESGAISRSSPPSDSGLGLSSDSDHNTSDASVSNSTPEKGSNSPALESHQADIFIEESPPERLARLRETVAAQLGRAVYQPSIPEHILIDDDEPYVVATGVSDEQFRVLSEILDGEDGKIDFFQSVLRINCGTSREHAAGVGVVEHCFEDSGFSRNAENGVSAAFDASITVPGGSIQPDSGYAPEGRLLTLGASVVIEVNAQGDSNALHLKPDLFLHPDGTVGYFFGIVFNRNARPAQRERYNSVRLISGRRDLWNPTRTARIAQERRDEEIGPLSLAFQQNTIPPAIFHWAGVFLEINVPHGIVPSPQYQGVLNAWTVNVHQVVTRLFARLGRPIPPI